MMAMNTEHLCRRQVDTLKIFNDNVLEVKKNEEYLLKFSSAGRPFKLNVLLGPNFPNEKPQLIIIPSVHHPWIHGDTGEIQNAPGYVNFTVHSDLGRVVHAIIREFEKFPPPLWHERHANQAHDMSQITVLPCNEVSSLPDLTALTMHELQELDNKPEVLNDFVEELDVIHNLNQELDSLISEVEQITEQNLSKEDQLKELVQAISESSSTIGRLGGAYENSTKRYQLKANEFAPNHIKELLQIAHSTADAKCDIHINDFLNEKIDVQEFLDRYMKVKVLSTTRKAKEERFSYQLNALERTRI